VFRSSSYRHLIRASGTSMSYPTCLIASCRNHGLVRVESTYQAYMVEISESCKMKLSRVLYMAVDYLTEYSERMCGLNSNKGKGVNKLLAPYDISKASIRQKLVSFSKEPLYSDTSLSSVCSLPGAFLALFLNYIYCRFNIAIFTTASCRQHGRPTSNAAEPQRPALQAR